MASFAATELQVALYDHLSALPQLTGRLTGIYDEAPHDAVFPYLSMGETRLTDAGVKDRRGVQLQFDLILVSGDNSQMEIKELMALTDAALIDADLPVRGIDLTTLRLESASSVRRFQEDGSYYEGRLRYRATLYAA